MKFLETKILSPIEFKIAKYISIAIAIIGTLNAITAQEPSILIQGLIIGPLLVFAFFAFFALGARFAESKGRDRETYLIISIITSPLVAAFIAYVLSNKDARSANKEKTKFDPTTQLLNLSELLKNGMITEEEFNAKKSAILDKM
jgi:hypothetical protein